MAMKDLLQLATASGALLLAKSALFGIRVVVLMLIAVYGQDTELASASFALSVTEIARWIADFGTDTWSVRAIALAGNPTKEARVVGTCLLIKGIGSVLVGPAIFAVCALKLPLRGWGFGAVAAVLLLTSQAIGLAISYFQAKGEVRKLGRMVMPCVITTAAACLSLLLTHRILLSFAVMAGGEVFIAGTLFTLLYRNVGRFDLTSAGEDISRTAVACLPAAALGIVVGVYSRIDSVVLAEFSFQALAAYTVAQRLFQPFQIAATSFGAVVYTRAAIANSLQRPYTKTFLGNEVPSVIAVSAGLGVILYVLGSALLQHVFPRYLSAQEPLTVLCGLLPLFAYNSAVCGLLLGYGWFWSVFLVGAVDLLLTYLVMIHLVPQYQAHGTVESLLIGALFNGVALSATMLFALRSRSRQTT
jgi:O-antigen/teichoic acid export membrane protein